MLTIHRAATGVIHRTVIVDWVVVVVVLVLVLVVTCVVTSIVTISQIGRVIIVVVVYLHVSLCISP